MKSERVRRLACAIAAGWIACTLGCREGAEPRVDPSKPRNAILIVLDTVRADHVSTVASKRRTTPTLEKLAERGVVFEQAISYAPWTMPSMVATMSGSWGRRPGLFVFGKLTRSLVETFRTAGFATAAFTEGGFVSRTLGFDRGFDSYTEEEGSVQLLLPGEQREDDPLGSIDRTFAGATRWLRNREDKPFFLMIHTYEPHTPYERRNFVRDLAPGAVGETFGTETVKRLRSGGLRFDTADLQYLSALYDGGILESDRHVEALLRELEELGIADETLIVVTSDHGEELGEHDPAAAGDHGDTLYDTLVRVPLLIVDPTAKFPVSRVSAQVRTIDILPTIASLLDVDLDAVSEKTTIDGQSLVPLMTGEESTGRIAFGGATRALPARNFVRYLGYKYIETVPDSPPESDRPIPAPRQLYDLNADPEEQINLIEREPELADRYQAWLHEHLAAHRGEVVEPELEAIPDALRERLRSLGYLD